MKTIDLAKRDLSLDEALNSARNESLLLKCANGEQFMVSLADDFASDPRDGVPLVRLAKRVTGAALRVVAHVDQDPGPA